MTTRGGTARGAHPAGSHASGSHATGSHATGSHASGEPASGEPASGRNSAGPPGQVVADRIIAKLRARGGRITASRRATIEVLLAGGDHRHLSADDIAVEVRSRLPDVAESTIYRTLAALEELGVITHVHLGHGPSTFHLADQPHRHLVCHHCERIIEVPFRDFAALSEHLATTYGFSISNEHFALVGECENCQRIHHL